MSALLADKISKQYGNHRALDEVSCQIIPSKITAVIGPSGCGKTTLLRMLSFLEIADQGTVSLESPAGSLVAGVDAPPWPKVTCVFQKQFLWPHLTLRENILLPLKARNDSAHLARFEDIIAMFKMGAFLDRYPNEVSGGEAQRAALARAFALGPEYILLDEAHTFLDMEQQAALNTYLRSLANRSIGLCVVTHSIGFVRAHADNIIVMEAGRVVENGGAEILQNPDSRFLKSVLAQQ